MGTVAAKRHAVFDSHERPPHRGHGAHCQRKLAGSARRIAYWPLDALPIRDCLEFTTFFATIIIVACRCIIFCSQRAPIGSLGGAFLISVTECHCLSQA